MKQSEEHKKAEKAQSTLREKILDVAEGLFAEKGYVQTSIREITKRAHCNIASVNYHFHGKENLYIEVFRLHMNDLRDRRIDAIREFMSDKRERGTLEELIHRFAEAFLEPFLNDGIGQRLMVLMMRERNDPHLPRHMFIEELVQPVKSIMKEALLQICPRLRDTAAELCIHSIVGQLVHVIQAQELFEGMDKATLPVLDLPKVVKHVVRFCLGGIKECMNMGPQRPPAQAT
ncbi:MAG: TetR/AcrR family transcriptional regulator [Phycisphaerae bacterium]|nr:TetR/AcrR family transcriptional regulator [Phycisphaerae bacterium]